MRRTICISSMILMLVVATASAQTAADAIRGRVRSGQTVWITDEQGREFRGRIVDLTPQGLSILDREERAEIPYGDIVKIERPHDGLGNGALIGLAAGAALGFGLVAADDVGTCEGFFCSNPSANEYLAVTAIFAGLGSAVGVGVDALIRRDRNIYRRGGTARLSVAPTFGNGRRGVALSVSW